MIFTLQLWEMTLIVFAAAMLGCLMGIAIMAALAMSKDDE